MASSETPSIEHSLEAVRRRIEAAARRAGRDPGMVTLVAVTKTVPPPQVEEAYRLGIRTFGENRVEEASDKIPAVDALLREAVSAGRGGAGDQPRVWHMIGHLQRRKVRDAVGLFELIHSVDSVRLAAEIDKRAAGDQVVPVLLEVNVSGESSTYGFAPDALAGAVAEMQSLSHVRVEGLMTVAPIVAEPEQARPFFRRLRELRDELGRHYPMLSWQHLSMGMTDDFEPAVEEGATLVRIGRAIFGERTRLNP